MHIRLTGDSINEGKCVRERGDGLVTCPGCVSAGINLGTTADPGQEQVVNL